MDNGEPPCITFAGLSLDEAISREILTVIEPAAIEAAVLATEQEQLQQDEIVPAPEAGVGGSAIYGASC